MNLPSFIKTRVLWLYLGLASIATFTSSASAQETAPTPWLPGYRFRVPVVVENKTNAALPAAPVLLRFDAVAQVFIGRLRRDGNDLRVTDANGDELPRYIEGLHDDSAPARVWVKGTPMDAGAKATYYIYYGNPTATAPPDAHAMIFGGTAQWAEGTVLSEDFENLSAEVKPIAGTNRIMPRGVLGYHGRGAWFNGQNAATTLKVPDPSSLSQGFTVSLWLKMLPHTIISPSALVDIDGAFLIRENEVILATNESRPVIGFKMPINEWIHVATTYDGAKLRVFANGQEVGAKEVKGTPAFPRGDVALGYDPGAGLYSPVVMDDFGLWTRVLTSFPDVHGFAVATNGKEEINAAVPEPTDPGTHLVYIPIEAENFEGIVDDRWRDKIYETTAIADKKQWFVAHDRPYLSRGYSIFTLTEGATASKTVQVPVDGNYHLWVRYAPVGEHEHLHGEYTGSSFQIKAEQNAQAVATHQFGSTLDFDTRQARWESMAMPLKKGAAKLVLNKNVAAPHAGEKIDHFVLTNDPNYVPDHRHSGMVWLRFKLLEAKNPGPFRSELYMMMHDEPWYAFANLNDREYRLSPGKDTGWIRGNEFLDRMRDVTITHWLFDEKGKRLDGGKVQLDYARAPRDSAIYKTAVTESTRAFGFVVMGPAGDLEIAESWSDSLEVLSQQHLDQANAQNWPKDNIPKGITVSATTSIGQFSDTVVRNELSTLRRMGMNFSTSDYDAWGGRAQTDIATKELGFDRTMFVYVLNNLPGEFRVKNSPYGEEFWKLIQREVNERVQALRDRSGEEEIKRVKWVQLNDEVEGWLSPGTILAQPESLLAFKKWLDEQKITPASLGVKSWDELQIVKSRLEAKTPEQKRLWMHEMDFQTFTTTMIYKRAGQIVEKAMGHAVETTLNPSPHQFLFRGWAEDAMGLNYLKFWQDGGVVMPWSEDWNYDNGLLYISNEISSYIAELTRAGSNHTRPTGMYVTSGNADSRRMKMFLALSRGAKHVNHYTYGPRFGNTEGSWSHHPEIFNQIGNINADIARADDLLFLGKMRKGQVALLYSWSADVWRRNNGGVAERFYQYLAHVHEQMPIDIMSEEQIAAGGLAGYKTLYVVDDNVRRATTQQIAKWVNAGGTLMAVLGAGTRDEFDADMTSFDTLLGLSKRTVQVTDDGSKFDYHRNGIGQLAQVGEISLNGPLGTGKLPVYAMKANAEAKSARTIGTWADGSPAATINSSGNGRAIWIGAYPGFSYARGGSLDAGPKTDYPADFRTIILAPARLSEVKRDVQLDVPVLEATLQESTQGAVVTLVNYTMKPIPEVTMTARTSKPVKRAVAVQSGKELKYSSTADGVTMKLPVGLTEFVKLYY